MTVVINVYGPFVVILTGIQGFAGFMTKSTPRRDKRCTSIAVNQGLLFDLDEYSPENMNPVIDRVDKNGSLQNVPGNEKQLNLSALAEQNSTPASGRTSASPDVPYPGIISVVDDCKPAATSVLPTDAATPNQCATDLQAVVTDSKPVVVRPSLCLRRLTDDLPLPDASGCTFVARQLPSATDAAEGRKIPVVNDCKEELWAETDGEFPGAGKGMVSSPQEKKMVSVEDVESVINRMKRMGDQQPMRDAVQLVRHFGLSVEGFAAADGKSKIKYINAFVAEMRRREETINCSKSRRITAGMSEPDRLASRMAHAFHQLALQFPNRGFPAVAPPLDRSIHPYRCVGETQLSVLTQQLDGWAPRIRGQDADAGTGKPLSSKTVVEYRTKVWLLVTFCTMAGITINPALELEFMTAHETIGLWLPVVKKHYSARGHAPMIAGIKRVVTDVFGANHANVQALAAVQRVATKEPDLSADEVEQLRDITRPEATAPCSIWEVPSQIEKRANTPRLKPSARDGRRASAVAAELLLCTIAFAPQHLARINLDTDIKGAEYDREVLCTDQNGKTMWCPLSKSACDRIDSLKQFRNENGRQSSWLFPKRGGHEPQERRVAMTSFGRDVHAVLGRRLRTVDFRDALLANAVDRGVDDAKLIADSIGVAPRTIERRLNLVFQNPLPPPGEEA